MNRRGFSLGVLGGLASLFGIGAVKAVKACGHPAHQWYFALDGSKRIKTFCRECGADTTNLCKDGSRTGQVGIKLDDVVHMNCVFATV